MLLFLFSLRSGIVESVFVSKELSSDSATNFVPHLTIAKMSRKPKTSGRKHKKQKKGKRASSDDSASELRGIHHSAYAELLDTEFGSQRIEGLELLSMILPSAEDGYYHCFQRHSFASTGTEDEVTD